MSLGVLSSPGLPIIPLAMYLQLKLCLESPRLHQLMNEEIWFSGAHFQNV